MFTENSCISQKVFIKQDNSIQIRSSLNKNQSVDLKIMLTFIIAVSLMKTEKITKDKAIDEKVYQIIALLANRENSWLIIRIIKIQIRNT